MTKKYECETKEYTDIKDLAWDLEIANEDPCTVFRILWWKNPVQVEYTTYDDEYETACLDIEDED